MNVQLPAIKASIVSICKARASSLDMMGQAAQTLAEGQELAKQAREFARTATQGAQSYNRPHDTKAARSLDFTIEAAKSVEAFRKELDADIWTGLLQTTGMSDMMDHTAKQEFRDSLLGEVPEATEDNISATMQNLMGNADLIFQRGLAKAFIKLDKRFKSHDGFKIGARMIMDNLFDQYGSWNGYHGKDEILSDIERVFAVLDGEKPNFNSLRDAISKSRGSYGGPRQSETEAAYFKVRGFKNGNAHLWFTRDDLVEKANKLLRDYYGEVLPDAATVNDTPTGTAVSTKLQFYATPPAVVARLLNDLLLKPGEKVLEPSCGDGAILRAIPAHCDVTAIEVHPIRAAYCGAICANFLTYQLPPVFDVVLMNPPFHGTHWMDHVRKAYEALKPGGILRAILPASAEVNESAKHDAFRAWATSVSKRNVWRMWTALPPESFASSGTNTSTVILEIIK